MNERLKRSLPWGVALFFSALALAMLGFSGLSSDEAKQLRGHLDVSLKTIERLQLATNELNVRIEGLRIKLEASEAECRSLRELLTNPPSKVNNKAPVLRDVPRPLEEK